MTITSDIAYQVRPTVRYHVYDAANDSIVDLTAWALGEGFDSVVAGSGNPSQHGGDGAPFWLDGTDVHMFQDASTDGVILVDGWYLTASYNINMGYQDSTTFHASWSETP